MNVQGSPEFELLSEITFAIGTKERIIGTGFLFALHGWAFTARHVIAGFPPDAIPVIYQERPMQAIVKRESARQDVAVLQVLGVEEGGLVALGSQRQWQGGDAIVAAGYQEQEFLLGLNPLELSIESNKPLAQVRFDDGNEQVCLVLLPKKDTYAIQAGTSGGPVFDKRTQRIVGMVIGTMGKKIIGEISHGKTFKATFDLGNRGFAVPLDHLFLDWPEFHRLLDRPVGTQLIVDPPVIDTPTLPPSTRIDLPMVFVPPAPAIPCFEMSVYLVTNRQFVAFLEENAYWQPGGPCQADGRVDAEYLANWSGGREDSAEKPVVYISWYAAEEYARWLGKQLGKSLRLPRQEEWEMAARAGRSGEVWHEEDIKLHRVNYANTDGRITPVGDYARNPYGLYDLLGNVYELCGSPDTGIYRCGGAFNSSSDDLRRQERWPPTRCSGDTGFRCVHDLSCTKGNNHA